MKSPRWLSSSSPTGDLERDRLLDDLQDLAHPLGGQVELGGQLFVGRLAAEVLQRAAA